VNKLNLLGEIARDMILKLPDYYTGVKVDHFVVMPNHVHLILVLEKSDNNLNQIIAQYKSGVSREIHKIDSDVSVWQRSYHDHVIRNQASYEKIWNYIEGNPLKWKEDCFYIDMNLIHSV
jgi:REP element-mobilizing transposase RayT